MKKALCALAFCLAACSPSGETVEGTVAYVFHKSPTPYWAAVSLAKKPKIPHYLIIVDKGEDFVLSDSKNKLKLRDRVKIEIGSCFNKINLEAKEKGKDWKTNSYWICDAKTLILGRFKDI